MFLVELKKDGVAVGICGLLNRDALDDVDIGFAFLPEFWGRGFASEAASAVLGLAQSEFGIDRIVAVTTPDNTASIRILERLGMAFEKMVRLSDDGPALRLYACCQPESET